MSNELSPPAPYGEANDEKDDFARDRRIARVVRAMVRATPGEWEIYSSNSWRRIGIKGDYRELIYPVRSAGDGHPDLGGPNLGHDLEYLMALQNLVAAHPQNILLLEKLMGGT